MGVQSAFWDVNRPEKTMFDEILSKKSVRKPARSTSFPEHRWHPDKARGDPERASRKMREVSDAKEALMAEYRC